MSPLQRAIRRRPADIDLSLGPSRLYLDDIRDIHDILVKFAEKRTVDNPNRMSPEVYLEAGEATAPSAEDLKDATSKELKEVRLYTFGSGSRIWVSLSPVRARISISADDVEGRALIEDIAHFVNRHRSSPTAALFSFPFMYLASLLAVVSLISAFWQGPLAGMLLHYPAIGLAGGLLATFTLGALVEYVFARKFGAVRVVAQWRSESRGLSQEMRRAIYIAIASAIVGGIVTAAIAAAIGEKTS